MYRMKNLTLLIILFFSFSCLGQEEKETVYLFFDLKSKEKCKVDIEGKGYLSLNKYRKGTAGDFTSFYICNEQFSSHNSRSYREVIEEGAIADYNIVNLEYIRKAKGKTILRYNPFKKIYLLERISKDKIIKIEVAWIDDWIMVND